MKKAVIIYNSKKGITKKYAEEINKLSCEQGVATVITSIQDFSLNQLENTTHILLGCWTSGLFIFLQHPEKEWVEFAKKLPDITGSKIAFFTTYKLATGSMFSNMKKYINQKISSVSLELKSKNGTLSEENKNN